MHGLSMHAVAFCCPLWGNGDDMYGNYDQDSSVFAPYPQAKINNPAVLSSFFYTPGDQLTYFGYPGLSAAKWVGKGNKGGCKMFWDCSSNKDKASCKAHGGVCVWQGTAGCVESPTFLQNVDSWDN